jgi:hypothetical protein
MVGEEDREEIWRKGDWRRKKDRMRKGWRRFPHLLILTLLAVRNIYLTQYFPQHIPRHKTVFRKSVIIGWITHQLYPRSFSLFPRLCGMRVERFQEPRFRKLPIEDAVIG